MFSVTACGGSEETPAATDDQKFVLKWAHSSPADGDRLGDASLVIIDQIAKESEGRLTFEYYPASQLGGERDQLEGISLGTVDLAILSTGPVEGFFPEISATAIPYLLTDRDTAWAVYDGAFGDKLKSMMYESTGMRVLGFAENGFRTFSNDVREVKTPADMKGLKFRTMENETHMAIVNSMGASAIPISFAELYTALAQGTVDGQENGIALTYNNKFYENLQYLTLDYHIYDPYLVIVAGKTWDSLPADLQEILQKGIDDYVALEREYNIRDDEKCLQLMKDAGLQVYEPTEADFAEFREATSGIEAMIRKNVGDEIVDEFLQAVEDAK